MIGWTAVIMSLQAWLSETPAQKSAAATPAYFSVGMAILALGVVSDSFAFAFSFAESVGARYRI